MMGKLGFDWPCVNQHPRQCYADFGANLNAKDGDDHILPSNARFLPIVIRSLESDSLDIDVNWEAGQVPSRPTHSVSGAAVYAEAEVGGSSIEDQPLGPKLHDLPCDMTTTSNLIRCFIVICSFLSLLAKCSVSQPFR